MGEVRLYGHALCPDIRARDVKQCRLLACSQCNALIIDLGTVVRGLSSGGGGVVVHMRGAVWVSGR